MDCETVATWIRKNSAESENLNWILANTKPCPKCKRPIEKNQGCMHMSCSQVRGRCQPGHRTCTATAFYLHPPLLTMRLLLIQVLPDH